MVLQEVDIQVEDAAESLSAKQVSGGGVAEWFRALDLKSGDPWSKSFTLPLSGLVLGSPEFNSSTALCK